MKKALLIIGGLVIVSLFACVILGLIVESPDQAAATTIAQTPTVLTESAQTTQTATAVASAPAANIFEPTATMESTGTPIPTDSPVLTDTPLPTETPEPTPTPEPTAPPEPVVLQGAGQTATDPITLPAPLCVAEFAHDGNRNFVVQVYAGDSRDLLINEIGPYRGTRPLVGSQPILLDIDADGAWTIVITPIGLADSASFTGHGDAVSGLFDPPTTGPWAFRHNGQRNFIVMLHCAGGSDLVQNEIGAIDGSGIVQFTEGPCFWEVQADGDWSLAPR